MVPKISIIIPTYNFLDRLDECVESVLEQLSADCECIIVDDGSDEKFREKLKKYEQCSKYLRVVYCPHKGAYSARNTGISLAKGRYIAFLDADDYMNCGFIDRAVGMLSSDADLYIFAIDTDTIDGDEHTYGKWELQDAVYESASDFADEYVRRHKLLLYSQCNKLYKRSVITKSSVRFQNKNFGEDRLFNYDFLKCADKIVTSSLSMFHYVIQKGGKSQSNRHIPFYFNEVMALHDKKMECILSLSKGTSEEEKHKFCQYDIGKEILNTVDRFDMHPEEKEQCLNSINKIIFGEDEENPEFADAVLVLGSKKCEYRVRHAAELYGNRNDMVFIVSGGNCYLDSSITEAGFMKNYLYKHGISAERILSEEQAKDTAENISYSEQLIKQWEISNKKELKSIIIVTAGFHILRVKDIVSKNSFFSGKDIYYEPAYGENTGKDNWFANEIGREIVIKDIEGR